MGRAAKETEGVGSAIMPRRFPPPRFIESQDVSFVVEPGRRSAAEHSRAMKEAI